jgi:cytochrome P450
MGRAAPRGHALFGHLVEFERDRLGFLERASRFGDTVALRFGPKRALLIVDPTLVRSVLATQARWFRKGYSVRMLRFLLGDGLLTLEGDAWAARRRATQPAFSRERVAAAVPLIRRALDRTISEWSDGDVREVYADMTALTVRVAARFILGVDLDADPRTADALVAAAEATARPRPKGLIRLLHLPTTLLDRRVRRVVRDLDRSIYSLISARRVEPSGDDVLSMLLRTQPQMSARQIRDDVVTLFFGAYDTTANALAWMLYLLASHPHIQRRIADEIASELGPREPEAGDLGRLRLTFATIHEALRLYPSGWAQSREAVSDCEVGGVRVKRGTLVVMSQWVTHRDARHFARPTDFVPDRWLAPDPPTHAFFPFGFGARRCIGAEFAMTESAVALAWILRRFELTPAAPPPAPEAVVTLRPSGPMLLTVRRRLLD